jgi:hypothetical protein
LVLPREVAVSDLCRVWVVVLRTFMGMCFSMLIMVFLMLLYRNLGLLLFLKLEGEVEKKVLCRVLRVQGRLWKEGKGLDEVRASA